MDTYRTGIIVAATLVAGCTAKVENSGPGNVPAGSGASTATGGSGNSPGTGGTVNTGGTANTGGTVSSGGTVSNGGTGGDGGTLNSGGAAGGPLVNCTQMVAPTSQVPRLTNIQYDRVVRDLLGVTTLTASGNVTPSQLLATDQAGGLTDLGWSAYRSVGEQIAAQVMADPTLKSKFLKCTPVAGDATCLHNTIIEFGRRAFRRPLATDEVARFDAVVANGAAITPTGAPEEIAEALLYHFLVSPSFLQRAEVAGSPDGAGTYTLSAHETASRLAFMLWGSAPDDLLAQAADTGALATPEQVLAQAQRMLQDPRARDMVNSFHQYYLLMGAGSRWNTAKKDPTLFPTFNEALVSEMTEETLRFFDRIAFTGGTFQDFILSPIAFVTSATAPFYGLNPASFTTTLTETTLDATRPGFLTRLGFLNNFANYSRTSPIFRGAFITKQILGIHIDAPPPGAEQTMLPTGPELDTVRKQIDAMTTGPDCSGCHMGFINPPGFVMEAFNSIGVWQTVEATTNAPIDMTADVTINADQDPVHITSPAEMMAQIAASPGAMRQYAAKWVGFAYERESDPMDACTADILAAKMTASGYTVMSLIADLTQTQSFRVRAAEVLP